MHNSWGNLMRQRFSLYLTFLSFLSGSLTIGGCTTASFAPPQVELANKVSGARKSQCRAEITDTTIEPDIAGALDLTNNFILAYRCAEREAADGRQIFQVPSFLAVVGAAIGPTFGLTKNGGIAAAGSAAVLNAGNTYYAPKQKTEVLDSALDALLCIKTEAVGVSFFDTRESAGAGNGLKFQSPTSSESNDYVEVDVKRQYFEMVTAGLMQVERILAKRFSDIGPFDVAGVMAELQKLQKEEDTAPQSIPELTTAITNLETEARGQDGPGHTATRAKIVALQNQRAIRIEMKQLQPKIQKCILRAKL
jgi:hypothetical protein